MRTREGEGGRRGPCVHGALCAWAYAAVAVAPPAVSVRVCTATQRAHPQRRPCTPVLTLTGPCVRARAPAARQHAHQQQRPHQAHRLWPQLHRRHRLHRQPGHTGAPLHAARPHARPCMRLPHTWHFQHQATQHPSASFARPRRCRRASGRWMSRTAPRGPSAAAATRPCERGGALRAGARACAHVCAHACCLGACVAAGAAALLQPAACTYELRMRARAGTMSASPAAPPAPWTRTRAGTATSATPATSARPCRARPP